MGDVLVHSRAVDAAALGDDFGDLWALPWIDPTYANPQSFEQKHTVGTVYGMGIGLPAGVDPGLGYNGAPEEPTLCLILVWESEAQNTVAHSSTQ